MSDGSMSQEEIDRLLNEVEPPLGNKQEDPITSFEKILAGVPVHFDKKTILILTPSMTLREYYAGQALAGLCASGLLKNDTADGFAESAFTLADAMVKVSSRKKNLS